jgi:hypothetical protein
VKRLLIALFVFAIGYGIGRSCGSTSYELISEANAQAKSGTILGAGAIAEDCERRFADPTAQIACEVYHHLFIWSGVMDQLEMHRRSINVIADIDDKQDAEIAELKSQLNALEAKRGGE